MRNSQNILVSPNQVATPIEGGASKTMGCKHGSIGAPMCLSPAMIEVLCLSRIRRGSDPDSGPSSARKGKSFLMVDKFFFATQSFSHSEVEMRFPTLSNKFLKNAYVFFQLDQVAKTDSLLHSISHPVSVSLSVKTRCLRSSTWRRAM